MLALFDKEDKGRVAFALAIPIGANIGGLGTPIGTPSNAIGESSCRDACSNFFGKWMAFEVFLYCLS